MLTHADILRARRRITPYIIPTPLEPAPALGANVWLKLENVNPTHSFKIRGALNAVLALSSEQRGRGLVTASSGNHAQGLAYAAALAGARVVILMPTHTPRRKIEGVRRHGAEVILFADTYDDCEAEARRLEREMGLTFVSAYNDLNVMAGAGTIGIEILESLLDVERVVVCVSGGGLISGVATAIKGLATHPVEVIGVNALSAPAMYNYLYDQHLPHQNDTLAEALSGTIEEGSLTLEVVRQTVDQIVLVDEVQIANAMRWMIDVQGWLVEGGGAVGVAAMLHQIIPADGRLTAVVVSGSNVDGDIIRKVLHHAL